MYISFLTDLWGLNVCFKYGNLRQGCYLVSSAAVNVESNPHIKAEALVRLYNYPLYFFARVFV